MGETDARRLFRFGTFEVDCQTGELRKSGRRISVQDKPFQVLVLLLEHPGELVTLEQFEIRLWSDVTVSFPENLRSAVRRLREVLGDNADAPHYIENLRDRGYRFIYPVEKDGKSDQHAGSLVPYPSTAIEAVHPRNHGEIEQVPLLKQSTDCDTPYQTASDLRADLSPLKGDIKTDHAAAPDAHVLPTFAPLTASTDSHLVGGVSSRRRAVALGLAFVLIAIVGTLVYELGIKGRPAGPNNLQNLNIVRLTNNGNILTAAISPDGKHVAYVTDESRPALWLRQVGAPGAVPILPAPAADGTYVSLTFSPDGSYIYFIRYLQNFFRELSVIPALGGTPKVIFKDATLWGGPGISPDGKRIAFTRLTAPNISELKVANADGSDEHLIARGIGPEDFAWPIPPTWSPDGKMLVALSYWRKGPYSQALRCFPLDGSSPTLLLASPGNIRDPVWLPDQRALLVKLAANEQDPSQIWLQPFPQGNLQKITNDLNDYNAQSGLSLTRDGKLLCAVQQEHSCKVFVGSSSDLDQGVPITTARNDGVSLAWMPNGKLLLVDDKGEFSSAQADGSGRIPLFRDQGYDLGRSVCRDGQHIVFSSHREGNRWNIWRADLSGRDLKQLTNGEDDVRPDCSPDGRWVIYNSHINGRVCLMKISIEGGPPSILARDAFVGPRYSPDGKQIVAFKAGETFWPSKIAILRATDAELLKTLDLIPHGTLGHYNFALLHWTPDGQALTYPLLQGSVMNLWKQPVDGGPPKQLTHLDDNIYSYDWSPNGKRLAISHGKDWSDIVLISNFH
jgi:Tol biopolymer transport system component/DNA-binding winged helix-turn-helix (wHTH) protein